MSRRGDDRIIWDSNKVEMNDPEAVAAIREAERTSGNHLPIIAVTAHAMKDDEERCVAAGMDGYVSKPIRPAALFAILERLAPSKLRMDGETVVPG